MTGPEKDEREALIVPIGRVAPDTVERIAAEATRSGTKAQANKRPFEHRLIVRETTFKPTGADADAGIQTIYRVRLRDDGRSGGAG
jgi:hypothetical protein